MRFIILCIFAILCTSTVQAQKSKDLYNKAKAAIEVYDYTTALVNLAAFQEVNKPKSESNEEFWVKTRNTYTQIADVCKERVNAYNDLQRKLMNCEPRATSVTGNMREPYIDELPPLFKKPSTPVVTQQPKLKAKTN